MLFFVLFRVQNFCCIVLALLTSGKGNGTGVYAEISFPEFYNFFLFILFSFYFFFTFYLPTTFTHTRDPRTTPTTHDLDPRPTILSYTRKTLKKNKANSTIRFGIIMFLSNFYNTTPSALPGVTFILCTG